MWIAWLRRCAKRGYQSDIYKRLGSLISVGIANIKGPFVQECKVASGRWTDLYSGEVFTDPGELDVDHMVPLRNAQRSGG